LVITGFFSSHAVVSGVSYCDAWQKYQVLFAAEERGKE
jgi:hypothetical protein